MRIHSSDIENDTYLICSSAAQEIKTEKQLKVSAYLCKVGVETIVWKEIKVTSINSAANYHENQFFSRKTISTYIYLKRNQ